MRQQRHKPGELRPCAGGCGSTVGQYMCEGCRDRSEGDARALVTLVRGKPGGWVHQDDAMAALGFGYGEEAVKRFKAALFRACNWEHGVELCIHGRDWYVALPPAAPKRDRVTSVQRWIRVTLPGAEPFLVGTANELVVDGEPPAAWALGKPEGLVALFYRKRGATFETVPR